LAYVTSDIDGRKEWADTFVRGLDVLGFKYEERTDPWEGACGVYSNVLAEAAIRFQAEAMSETFPAAGPVKVKVLGEETKEKMEAAQRVKADMNYELTERMVEYRSEHERMLYSLGLAGSAFKKVYYDPNMGRQVAVYIPAEDVIVPYGASHIETAERVTHIMRKTKNELRSYRRLGSIATWSWVSRSRTTPILKSGRPRKGAIHSTMTTGLRSTKSMRIWSLKGSTTRMTLLSPMSSPSNGD
jgi:hypothetical protein